MIRVDIRTLSQKRRGRVVFRPISARVGTIKAYRKHLRQIEATIMAAVKRDILPRYGWTPAPGHTQDDVFSGWFDQLEADLAALLARSRQFIRGLLTKEADWTSDTFAANVRALMGVDLAGVIRSEDLADYLDAAVERNVALVKGLSDDGQKALRAAVTEAYLNGDSPERLQALIRKRLGFMKSRAELIALDQIAKTSSEVNEIRQRQAGVDSYVWMTSRDERVRPRHRKLDGKTYKWGEPTGAEEGLPPGRPIRCFAGSNRFFADHGVERFFRYWHTGETAKVVTHAGEVLRATANHPMLTDRGWKRVQDLEVGDNLIRAQAPSIFAGDVDVEQRHPRFADAFEFMRAFGQETRVGVRGDLYGDPVVDKEIEVVGGQRKLLVDGEAFPAEQVGKFIFEQTLVRFPLATGGADLLPKFLGLGDTSNGIVRGLREIEAFLLAQAGHANGIGAAAIPQLHADTLDVIGNGATGNAVPFGEGQNAVASDVPAHHFAAIELARIVRLAVEFWDGETPARPESVADRAATKTEFGGDVLEHLPGVEFFNSPVKDVIWDRGGHFVYSAETALGWYSTETLAAGNCRCIARGVVEW